jgi:hypothetical protein
LSLVVERVTQCAGTASGRRNVMRFASVAVLVMSLALTGCTQGLQGVPMKMPATTGKVVAAATTSEREGLRVLWNGRTRGADGKWKAWIAGSPDELEAVWSAAAAGTPPSIDFARYIVLAQAGEGGVCNPKIVGIEAEASGLLRLRYAPETTPTTCILLATRIAKIVAVPRRILTATVVFLDGYAFAVPDVPFG